MMQLIGQTLTIAILFTVTYFEVFMLLTYMEERGQMHFNARPRASDASLPTVTIIVPAWNEGTTILGTINSILALDYPKDKLDVFFVNDGSTDNTLEVAKEHFGSNPRVKIISKENGGKHTAMNLGIEKSTADIIGCLDADSYVESDALREMIPFFDNSEVVSVTPSVQIWKPDNWLRHIQAIEYMVGAFTRKVLSRINALYVTPGPFSLFRRELFAKIGNFRSAYHTEDMEMALRIQSHKLKIENAHMAIVWTVPPKTLAALYKQRVRWVTGFLKNAYYSYRHMFMKSEYGYLGVLSLPFAFISIFTALFFTVAYVKTVIKSIGEEIIYRQAVGFHLAWPSTNVDLFSYDLTFNRLLVYVLFLGTLLYIMFGVRLVRKQYTVARGTLSFLFLYGLIAPFWLGKSLYNLITSNETTWR